MQAVKAERTAHAVRTWLSVVEVEARKHLLLIGGRGESSKHRTVLLKLVQLFSLLLRMRFFKQGVALIPKSFAQYISATLRKTTHHLDIFVRKPLSCSSGIFRIP